jgi:GNAT superfamily N-acetyltransferase
MNVTYSNILSVENYCSLRESVGFYEIPVKYIKAALEKSDYIISAIVDEIPVGMARLITDGTQVLIMDVVVHPNYQKRGIGKGLMEHIIKYIKGMDYTQMLVNLLTDNSKIGFYEKLGFSKAEGMRLWLKQK